MKHFLTLVILAIALTSNAQKLVEGGGVIGSPNPLPSLPPTTNYAVGNGDITPPPTPPISTWGRSTTRVHCPSFRWKETISFQYGQFKVDKIGAPGAIFENIEKLVYLLTYVEKGTDSNVYFFGSGSHTVSKEGLNLECLEISPETDFIQWRNEGWQTIGIQSVSFLQIPDCLRSTHFHCGLKLPLFKKDNDRYFLFPGNYTLTPYKTDADGFEMKGESVNWSIPAPPMPK